MFAVGTRLSTRYLIQFFPLTAFGSPEISMGTTLSRIKERFPDEFKLIEVLHRENTSFNSLCDDYCSVEEQIRKIEGSGKAVSSSDIGELKLLLRELEDEFRLYFKNV